MKRAKFMDPSVAEVFVAFPMEMKPVMLELRALIFSVASGTPGVGPILEALRWGQPSYLTAATGSGSTIRIDQFKPQPGKLAIYFHCQSGLIGEFRELYGHQLKFGGKRCIILDAQETLPKEPLGHCIRLALTYHQRKKSGPKTRRK